MSDQPKVNLAVVGSSSLVGESLINLLDERRFPLAELFPLEQGEGASGRIECAGHHWHVTDVADFDFTRVAIAIFCGSEALSQEWAESAAEAGALVIDLASAHLEQPWIPMVIAGYNESLLADIRESGMVVSPSALATALVLALEPIRALAGVTRVEVATYQSLSQHGREGVEELARQTVSLLNCRDIEGNPFPAQVAFNTLPQVGALDTEGGSAYERRLEGECERLFNGLIPPVSVTAVQVPTFYGDALVAHIDVEQPVVVESLRAALAESEQVTFVDETEGAGYPTPVGDAVGSDRPLIGRLRQHAHYPDRFSFWATVDNLRKGSALNGVQIAEILVKDYI